MSQVIANLAMSIDGFIADPDDGCDDLFGFYDNGYDRAPALGRLADVPHGRAER